MCESSNGKEDSHKTKNTSNPNTVKYEKCENCQGDGVDAWGDICRICEGNGKIFFDTDARKNRKSSNDIKRNKRYVISMHGNDALMKFGKYSGKQLTDIFTIDKNYLDWILEQKFPNDIKDVCRFIKNEHIKMRSKAKAAREAMQRLK